MSAANVGPKRRWLISAIGAAIAMALLLPLFRKPTVRPPVSMPTATRKAEPSVKITPGHADELVMRDLRPLFLPTPFNAAPSEPAHLEPGSALLDRDDEKLKFTDEDPALRLPMPIHVPATPLEALGNPPGPLTTGIGRTSAKIEPAPAHGAYVDVFVAGTDKRVFDETLSLSSAAKPVSANHEIRDWQPLEFLAAVDAAGLVGPLLLTRGSGAEDVDTHFRNYLARTFDIGDRLPPGFYRIVVAP